MPPGEQPLKKKTTRHRLTSGWCGNSLNCLKLPEMQRIPPLSLSSFNVYKKLSIVWSVIFVVYKISAFQFPRACKITPPNSIQFMTKGSVCLHVSHHLIISVWINIFQIWNRHGKIYSSVFFLWVINQDLHTKHLGDARARSVFIRGLSKSMNGGGPCSHWSVRPWSVYHTRCIKRKISEKVTRLFGHIFRISLIRLRFCVYCLVTEGFILVDNRWHLLTFLKF